MAPIVPTEKTSNGEPKMATIFPIPPLVQAPFFSQQFFKPNPKLFSMAPLDILQNFHKEIASTAQKCLQFVQISVTHNPFLSKILSLSSHIHNFSQVQFRTPRSMNPLSNHNFAAVLPGGDSVAGIVVANGILNFLNLYNTLLVVRLVLTWFPNTPPQIVSPLSTICDPYLNIFRGLIPPIGGALDLSPILAFLVLNVFTSTAAALPAELPPELPSSGVSYDGSSLPRISSDLTTSQEKWRRRLQGSKTSNSNGAS